MTTTGLAKLEGSQWTVIGIAGEPRSANVFSLMIDSQGTLWCSIMGKAFRLLKGEKEFREIPEHLSAGSDFAEAASGEVWMLNGIDSLRVAKNDSTGVRAVSSGRLVIDQEGGLWTPVTEGDEIAHVPPSDPALRSGRVRLQVGSALLNRGVDVGVITGILEDLEGNIWFQGSRSLTRLSDGRLTPTLTSPSVPKSIFSSHGGVTAANDGGIWISQPGTRPLYRLEGGKVTTYDALAGVTSAIRTAQGSVWFCGFSDCGDTRRVDSNTALCRVALARARFKPSPKTPPAMSGFPSLERECSGSRAANGRPTAGWTPCRD